MTRSSTDDESRPPPTRKATLFCPACEHTAALDGDWRTVTENETTLLVCPRCEEVVDRRPGRARVPVLTA